MSSVPTINTVARSLTEQARGHLAARGITNKAIYNSKVEVTGLFGRPAVIFPAETIGGIVLRKKAIFVDGREPRSSWLPPANELASSCLFGIHSVVAGQSLLFLEGEKDALLAHSLGWAAVTGMCGASTPPSGVGLDDLEAQHPARALVYYDVDDAGRKGAVATVRALRSAGISAGAFNLPASLGTGGDFTDLYRLCDKDATRLLQALHTCAPLRIDDAAEVRRCARPVSDHSADRDTFNRGNSVVDVLKCHGVDLKRSGAHTSSLCPFHVERTASFKVSPDEQHWRCFGACQTGGDAYWLSRMFEQRGY